MTEQKTISEVISAWKSDKRQYVKKLQRKLDGDEKKLLKGKKKK